MCLRCYMLSINIVASEIMHSSGLLKSYCVILPVCYLTLELPCNIPWKWYFLWHARCRSHNICSADNVALHRHCSVLLSVILEFMSHNSGVLPVVLAPVPLAQASMRTPRGRNFPRIFWQPFFSRHSPASSSVKAEISEQSGCAVIN